MNIIIVTKCCISYLKILYCTLFFIDFYFINISNTLNSLKNSRIVFNLINISSKKIF